MSASASVRRTQAWAGLLQRQLVLAAVALLGAVGAVAGAATRDAHPGAPLPKSVPAPGGGWYSALAGPTSRPTGRRSACGHLITALSVGIAHPVLPCDVKVFIRYGKRTVLTQVIDRGPYVPGREFELTGELAKLLGVHGTQPIRWRYAG